MPPEPPNWALQHCCIKVNRVRNVLLFQQHSFIEIMMENNTSLLHLALDAGLVGFFGTRLSPVVSNIPRKGKG